MLTFSPSTIIGIVIGLGSFIYSITLSTDNTPIFISMNAFLLVVGGTFASTMIAYQGTYVFRTIVSLFSIIGPFKLSSKTLFQDVGRMIEFSTIVKNKGPLGVEKALTDAERNDPIIHHGINLLNSGYNADEILDMLTDTTHTHFERKMVQVDILSSMASFSPSFGMIGTLVGLIIMFEKMGSDLSQIGIGMALALLTTLYGILLSQLIFKPASEKLRQRQEIYRYRNTLLSHGISMIAAGKDTLSIQDKLNSMLDPKLHFNIAKKGS